MHLQANERDWDKAVPALPRGAMLKGFSISLLIDGVRFWERAGHSRQDLFTVLRHDDASWYPRFEAEPHDFDWHRALWRRNFNTVVDRTFLENVWAVRALETLNEHTDLRMMTDVTLLQQHLVTEQAAVAVWNDEFRGRTVHSHDGAVGAIPGNLRLIIVNGPEGNPIPEPFFRLCERADAILGYHAYIPCKGGQPTPGWWEDVAGLWARQDAEFGYRGDWALTEEAPLGTTFADGWRNKDVCGEQVPALLDAFEAWWRRCLQTRPALEGRLQGWTGAWFTSGHVGWTSFQLEGSQLLALAERASQVYQEVGVEASQKAAVIHAHARAILDLVEPDRPWWDYLELPARPGAAAPNKVLEFCHQDGTLLVPNPHPAAVTWQLDFFEIDPAAGTVRVTEKPINGQHLWAPLAALSPVRP